jgi:DNA-directed RNA polymerase specialized sigma24 family protein
MRKRLLRFLYSRGISAHAAEDAVQDVAERLLTRQVPHTDVEDLMRWCMTVARNSAIDQHRRVRRSVPLDCRDADADDGSELVDMVEARIRLDRVLRALGTMSYEDARCVMASIDDDIAEVASPALRARRHRLRRRLSELVGGFGLIGVAVRALRPRVGRAGLGLGSAAMASVALVTVVVGGPPFATSPDQIRLHTTHATVRTLPAADGSAVVRRSDALTTGAGRRAPAAPVGAPRSPRPAPLHLRTPDKGGTVDVQTHDRGPSDHGVLCVGGLVYVDDVCVAPALTGRHLPPAQLRSR